MNTAVSRLRKEYSRIQKGEELDSKFILSPDENNFLKWHFLLMNMEGPFQNGFYHGELNFPSNYPFKPPSLVFHTPSGRFQVGKKICLSFTSYHPETWNPYWRVESMLESLISFMYTNDRTTGGIKCNDSIKSKLAESSWDFNHTKNPEFIRNFSKFALEKFKLPPKDEEEKLNSKKSAKIGIPLSITLLLGVIIYALGN